jgi:hypothetical protein
MTVSHTETTWGVKSPPMVGRGLGRTVALGGGTEGWVVAVAEVAEGAGVSLGVLAVVGVVVGVEEGKGVLVAGVTATVCVGALTTVIVAVAGGSGDAAGAQPAAIIRIAPIMMAPNLAKTRRSINPPVLLPTTVFSMIMVSPISREIIRYPPTLNKINPAVS